MPRKTPEERATDAVDALVAKRDKHQAIADECNELLQKLGIAIGAQSPAIGGTNTGELTKSPNEDAAPKAKMAGEGPESDEPPKTFDELVKEAKEEDKFPATIRPYVEPDFAAIMAEDDDVSVPDDLPPGDTMGAGRMV